MFTTQSPIFQLRRLWLGETKAIDVRVANGILNVVRDASNVLDGVLAATGSNYLQSTTNNIVIGESIRSTVFKYVGEFRPSCGGLNRYNGWKRSSCWNESVCFKRQLYALSEYSHQHLSASVNNVGRLDSAFEKSIKQPAIRQMIFLPRWIRVWLRMEMQSETPERARFHGYLIDFRPELRHATSDGQQFCSVP